VPAERCEISCSLRLYYYFHFVIPSALLEGAFSLIHTI
jgi:hypothetical protein